MNSAASIADEAKSTKKLDEFPSWRLLRPRMDGDGDDDLGMTMTTIPPLSTTETLMPIQLC
jgi:hypothetical protein